MALDVRLDYFLHDLIISSTINWFYITRKGIKPGQTAAAAQAAAVQVAAAEAAVAEATAAEAAAAHTAVAAQVATGIAGGGVLEKWKEEVVRRVAACTRISSEYIVIWLCIHSHSLFFIRTSKNWVRLICS